MFNITESLDESQSFLTKPKETCDTNITVNCLDEIDEIDETKCPDGVCPMPVKNSIKRKMRPPESIDQEDVSVPQLDKLFSQLFGSLPGGSSDPMAVLDSIMKGNTNSVKEDEDADDSDDDDSDDDDSEDEDSDDEDSEDEDCRRSRLDKRWDTINKLVESHVNISRAVADLSKKG
jgi:hypothetical protein